MRHFHLTRDANFRKKYGDRLSPDCELQILYGGIQKQEARSLCQPLSKSRHGAQARVLLCPKSRVIAFVSENFRGRPPGGRQVSPVSGLAGTGRQRHITRGTRGTWRWRHSGVAAACG